MPFVPHKPANQMLATKTAAPSAGIITFIGTPTVPAHDHTSASLAAESTPAWETTPPPPPPPPHPPASNKPHAGRQAACPPPAAVNMLKPTTPTKIDRLRTLLVDHPDRQSTEYILHDLGRGFSVGYTLPLENTSSPNLPSASQRPDFVFTSLQEACRRGETAGPFDTKPFPTLYISGVGVVPKKSGKLRLIHHLSSPSGRSVNDGIPKADFSFHYVTIDNAISAPTSRSWLLPIKS